MNLLQISSDVVEAVRGQKHLDTLTHRLVHLSVPVLLTKDLPSFISYDSQPPFSLHILEPSPQGFLSSSE